MLPAKIHKGRPHILRRTILPSQTAAGGRGSLAILSLQQHRSSHRNFWESNTWSSHLDPSYHDYHRKRQQRARAAFRETLRRKSKWLLPEPLKGSFGSRLASHSSKSFKEWAKLTDELAKDTKKISEDDYELTPGEKRWKKQTERMRRQVQSDPYQAVFGRSFTPFWAAWTDKTSDSQAEMDTAQPSTISKAKQHETDDNKSSSKKEKDPREESKDINMKRDPTTGFYMESSSLRYSSRHEPGKKPSIKASAESWDSKSNVVKRMEYDPISNRMVSRDDDLSSEPTQKVAISSNSDNKAVDVPITKHECTPDAADDIETMTVKSLRSSIRAKRRMLDQQTSAEGGFVRFTPTPAYNDGSSKAQQTLHDIEHHQDVAKPKRSLEQQVVDYQDTIALMSAELKKQAALIATLQQSHGHHHETDPKTAAQIRKAVRKLDGHSKEPMGLQTSFEAEKKAYGDEGSYPLEKELAQQSTEAVQFDDGYTNEPIGLQETYAREREEVTNQERPSLSEELDESTTTAEPYDDGYSDKPMGLQQTFAQERKEVSSQERPSLSDELDGTLQIEETPDDGYSNKPIGLQQTFAQEWKDVKEQGRLSLSEELKGSTATNETYDDGYTQKPIGLQQTFAQEWKDVKDRSRPSLSEELINSTTTPVYNDGYTDKPFGLQNTFAQERADVNEHLRPSLSNELNEHNVSNEAYEDGYTQKPIGMQQTYARERDEVRKQGRPSLSDELSDTVTEGVFEEGYSDKPIGMQQTFAQERADVKQRKRVPLSEELRDLGNAERDTQHKSVHKQSLPKNSAVPADTAAVEDAQSALEKELTHYDDLAAGQQHLPNVATSDTESSAVVTSTIPGGLENSYAREHAKPSISLEEELKVASPGVEAVPGRPQGLRSLYDQNIEARTPALLHLKGTDKRSKAAHALMQEEVDRVKDSLNLYEEREMLDRKPKLSTIAGAKDVPQAEGDISADAVKFGSSGKWYKQDESLRARSTLLDDNHLASQIRQIAKDNGLLALLNGETTSEAKEISPLAMDGPLTGHEAGVASDAKLKSNINMIEEDATVKEELKVPAEPTPLQWASPPSYKILAFDAGNGSISTATTMSSFAETESAMTVVEALRRLDSPSDFMPHFATLQNEGFQAVHASGNLLVLRKVHKATSAAEEESAAATASEVPAGKEHINPVDGMTRPIINESVPTGNYASPTGFVNYDPVVPPSQEPAACKTNNASGGKRDDNAGAGARPTTVADGIYYRHYPPVRRQEAVFSGTRRHNEHSGRHEHNGQSGRHQYGRHQHKKRATWKRRVRFALSVGATSAALVYALGVGSQFVQGGGGSGRADPGGPAGPGGPGGQVMKYVQG